MLFRTGSLILLEQYVRGREFSCGVLENPETDETDVLPVVEIRPKTSTYFDVKAKYESGACDEIVPAPINEVLTKRIQQIAQTAHQTLGCRTYSRSDMIVSESEQQVFLLETNTLPGFTATSLLPQEAKAAGMDFGALLDRVVAVSLKKKL